MKERAPRIGAKHERRETSHERLLRALETLPDLPKTLEHALHDARTGNIPRQSIETHHEHSLDFQKVVDEFISDEKLKGALTHLLSIDGHSHVRETPHDPDETYIFDLWRDILHKISDIHGRDRQDIERDLFLFQHEWKLLSPHEQPHVREKLLERLRYTFFSSRDAAE